MQEAVNTSRMAELVAGFANEKKAEDALILDMSRVSGICDFFVIVSASSSVRAKTIAENIEERMRGRGFRPIHREGHKEGKWILIDFGDVVAHVFLDETRRYYDLENLWGDAPRRSYTKDPES